MDALRLSLAAHQGDGPLGLLLPTKGSGSTGRLLMLVKLPTTQSSPAPSPPASIITVNSLPPVPFLFRSLQPQARTSSRVGWAGSLMTMLNVVMPTVLRYLSSRPSTVSKPEYGRRLVEASPAVIRFQNKEK